MHIQVCTQQKPTLTQYSILHVLFLYSRRGQTEFNMKEADYKSMLSLDKRAQNIVMMILADFRVADNDFLVPDWLINYKKWHKLMMLGHNYIIKNNK